MEIQIKVLAVEIESKPNKKGGVYQQATVSYKDLGDGKVTAQKIMDFSDKELFKTVAAMKGGEEYTITKEKRGDYWNWVAATLGVSGVQSAAAVPSGTRTSTNIERTTAVRGNYETAEERAARQRYIIRQSSLSAAIAVLSPGAKAPLDAAAVKALADDFTDWVFEKKEGVAAMIDAKDDLPF